MSEEEKLAEIERLGAEIRKHDASTTLYLETAKFLNKDLERISKAMEAPDLTSEQVDLLLRELRFIENKFLFERRMLDEDDAKLAALKKRLGEL